MLFGEVKCGNIGVNSVLAGTETSVKVNLLG